MGENPFRIPDLVGIILHKIPKEYWHLFRLINSICNNVVTKSVKKVINQLNPFAIFNAHIQDKNIEICPKCFKKWETYPKHKCSSVWYTCGQCHEMTFKEGYFTKHACGHYSCPNVIHSFNCGSCLKTFCLGCFYQVKGLFVCRQCANGPTCFNCGETNKKHFKYSKTYPKIYKQSEAICFKCQKCVCNKCAAITNIFKRTRLCSNCSAYAFHLF
jgi:hypothetical protein